MAKFKNTMEIFTLLDKSNCRKCGKKTCLAFAASVFQGEKKLGDCPLLEKDIIERYEKDELPEDGHPVRSIIQENQDAFMEEMKQKISKVNLEEAALRTGGKFDGGKLTIKILGKDFSVDQNGAIYTGIHVNPWIAAPVFNYILHSEGKEPTGKWVAFRDLKDGRERYPLFRQRCEMPMKKVADIYTDLFSDMVSVLNGKEVAREFQSDISVVMHVLPKVPVMICYWLPEDGLDSSLNIYFDETADRNLEIGAIFSLGAGLTQMFTKMAITHGYEVSLDANHR
ncbi:Fe-S cluster domain protein [Desulfamplus magnetovallimortis]|uniref:Fe-S cluster domain protein n=1 Tax=Desulfamplus magnetovallimortis TaxID=1246637 RepID=A0A1W1H611_9BACT|nr:DUF3786 domain-containing protein [Desulfamplus magnetovallimortis]SLM27892.1 Fe-S cluster domain protein [Desulfamplus magnetovallimortis]